MKEYQEFPISNFRVGFDEAVEPWMIPGDAFQIMKNAHLYRGVLEKIQGYDLYAKMSYRIIMSLTGAINGVNKVYTGTLAHTPSTDNITVQGATNAGATTIETFTYSSSTLPNIINLSSSGGGTGTINLTTLAISVTFGVAPVPFGFNSVILTYDYLSTAVVGSTADIMGIKPYYTSSGGEEILIFNTRRVGKIVTITDAILGAAAGSDNGVSEIPHDVQVEDQTHAPAFNGANLVFTGTVSAPVVPGSVRMFLYDQTTTPVSIKTTITDNGIGLLTGAGLPTATGFINYATGAWTLTFAPGPSAPLATDTLNSIVANYGDVFTGDFTNFFSVANYTYKAFITNNVDAIRYYDGVSLKYLNTNLAEVVDPSDFTYDITRCLHVFIERERLLLIRPTVNGVAVQNGIYWSVSGDPLDFSNDEQLLAPTSESIRTIAKITTNLIIRFTNSERIFAYTGDAFSPFRFDNTNLIWRCDANFSAINYDSYFTSVGKPAIVASDGVNIKRNDEIIPDFTLDNRALLEGPIISIDQTSIGQCYGERFDDFKEGWLCFKQYTNNETNAIERSDAVLAYNYMDQTYAVYEFAFNVLGFGRVTSIDTWGNNYDLWGDANYSWDSFWETFNALVDLGGDRLGNVYTLGNANFLIDEDGNQAPVLFDVISKNFNPFIEQGELCRFGYLDLFVSANATTKLRVQFYRDDVMYEGPDGDPTGFYQETTLTFTPTDVMSSVAQSKIWKRIYVGAVAKEHTIRIYQNTADFTADTLNQPVRIHALVLYMKPAGRIFS